MKNAELLPCPFCGASGDALKLQGFDDGVLCHGCGAWMPSRSSSNPGESHGAVEGWNRRAVTKTHECLGDLWQALQDVIPVGDVHYHQIRAAFFRRRRLGSQPLHNPSNDSPAQ